MAFEGSKPVLVFGTGPFAELMLYHFRQEAEVEIVGLTVNREYVVNDRMHGLPVIALEDLEERFPPTHYDLFLAVGYKRMRERERLFRQAKSKGYTLISFVSRQSRVHGPRAMGENNIVLDGVIIEPFCSLGDNNVFWSGALLCHGGRVGNHNFFAAGTILGGNCVVGDGCFLGFGATVLDQVRLANETLVGARALVLADTQAATKYLGSPAIALGTHRKEGIVIAR